MLTIIPPPYMKYSCLIQVTQTCATIQTRISRCNINKEKLDLSSGNKESGKTNLHFQFVELLYKRQTKSQFAKVYRFVFFRILVKEDSVKDKYLPPSKRQVF